MKKRGGMTFEELLDELKRMKKQMRNFKELQKESNRLDAEYYHLKKISQERDLPEIIIP